MKPKNQRKTTKSLLLLLLLLTVIIFGCRKDELLNTSSSFRLSFSADTVMFDTVFTTLGSTTQWLKIYNNSSQKVIVSRIQLAGGASSLFRINVDGLPGTTFKNIEIEGKDSLWVFVEVTIDPKNSNTPMIVTDSIIFEVNGTIQDVDLVAWGQDAHFITPNTFINGLPPFRIVASENEVTHWVNDKPYVVYGYAVVDSMGTLIIDKGCRIHFHNNSGLWVYKEGCIQVNGTKDEPVSFQGSRLESFYADVAGQWDRIWLNESSRDHVFKHAIIRNAFVGIQAEALDYYGSGTLKLYNTRIENMVLRSLFTKTYRVEAYNSIIANSGEVTALLSAGGSYEFRHCTFGGYWTGSVRQTPLLVVSNFYDDKYNNVVYVSDLSKALFANCIIYGNNSEELHLGKHSTASVQFNYSFDHCLIRTEKAATTAGFKGVILNKDPKMISPSNFVFRLNTGSPCINAGNPLYGIRGDIEDEMRDLQPDIGAYEFRP